MVVGTWRYVEYSNNCKKLHTTLCTALPHGSMPRTSLLLVGWHYVVYCSATWQHATYKSSSCGLTLRCVLLCHMAACHVQVFFLWADTTLCTALPHGSMPRTSLFLVGWCISCLYGHVPEYPGRKKGTLLYIGGVTGTAEPAIVWVEQLEPLFGRNLCVLTCFGGKSLVPTGGKLCIDFQCVHTFTLLGNVKYFSHRRV